MLLPSAVPAGPGLACQPQAENAAAFRRVVGFLHRRQLVLGVGDAHQDTVRHIAHQHLTALSRWPTAAQEVQLLLGLRDLPSHRP